MVRGCMGEVRAEVEEVKDEEIIRSVIIKFSLPESIQSATQIEFALKGGGIDGKGGGYCAILRSLERDGHEDERSVMAQVQLSYQLDEQNARARFRRRKALLCVEIPVLMDDAHVELSRLAIDPAAGETTEVDLSDAVKTVGDSLEANDQSITIHMEEKFSIQSNRSRGRHVVSSQTMSEGECIWFEEPLVIVKPGMEVEGLPNQTDEWILTYLLLREGLDKAWSEAYVTDARAAEIESNDNIPWLANYYRCSEEVVLSVFRAVANNAFSLDTALLRVKYGAAFYRYASYFNHSCSPNCFSRRMGGNMALFTNRPCKPGEELTHSYLPVELIAAPIEVRAANLHFVCKCERCSFERTNLHSSSLRDLGFTKEFSSSHLGRFVADFKVACVASHSKVALPDECEVIVSRGNTCLRACFSFLWEHPVAALEIVIPYLQALWGGLVAGSASLTAAFGSGEASREMARLRLGARSAAALFQHASRSLWEEKSGMVPCAVGKMLHAESCIVMYLLDGCGSEKSLGDLADGLQGIHDMHANSLLVLNEDLSCLDLFEDISCPPLRSCCTEFQHLCKHNRGKMITQLKKAIRRRCMLCRQTIISAESCFECSDCLKQNRSGLAEGRDLAVATLIYFTACLHVASRDVKRQGDATGR
eukprot:752322-Hanusia_phi.AAC.6